jgi:hypothetical protein
MFTENEVGQLLEIPAVQDVVVRLHGTFKEEEGEFKEISLHDFLSGMLMAPAVALARVDGTTTLFEELSLNKKARRFSKGGYFLQQDPVVRMVIRLQSRFLFWEELFFEGINKILKVVIPEISTGEDSKSKDAEPGIFLAVMKSSYILIRFLETFFLPEGEEITSKRCISILERQKIISIGDRLQLSDIGSFRNFMKTFEVN